jgi:hypothetical protein
MGNYGCLGHMLGFTEFRRRGYRRCPLLQTGSGKRPERKHADNLALELEGRA